MNITERFYYTAVQNEYNREILFIRWADFNTFTETILSLREMMLDESISSFEQWVEIGTFVDLSVNEDDNMWVAKNFNRVHSGTISFSRDWWYEPEDFKIQNLTNIQLSSDHKFTYVFNNGTSVDSSILLNMDEYDRETLLPVWKQNNDYEYLYLITEIIDEGSRISVSKVKVDDVENQNEILPIPAKRTKKYTNPNFGSSLFEEYNVYSGQFDLCTTTTNQRTNYSKMQLDIASEKIVDEAPIIKHKCTSLYDSVNITKRGSGYTWKDNSTNLYSFVADSLHIRFRLVNINADRESVEASLWIPIIDFGEQPRNFRFRSLYKLDRIVEYMGQRCEFCAIDSNNIQHLINFFKSYSSSLTPQVSLKDVTVNLIPRIYSDVSIVYGLQENNFEKLQPFSDEVIFKRNYEREFDTIYAWDQYQRIQIGMGMTDPVKSLRPVILSKVPNYGNPNEYIVCKTCDTIDNSELSAPDRHVYTLMKVRRQAPTYNDIVETITEHSDATDEAGYIQNTYSYLNPSLFEQACVVENNLYKQDNSIDQLRVDKIERFCNSFEINGEDVLLMMQELKTLSSIVSELDQRVKELEGK